jgi:tRNA(Ile)-lysidine synthase
MAASTTATPDASSNPCLPLPPITGRVAVAFSGGADSTALLLAAYEAYPGRVVAIHVNHQLQTAAADFEVHCAKTCRALAVPLEVRRVMVACGPRQSLEAQARAIRYDTLATVAKQVNAAVVLLAQHEHDQLETVLIALSRGAGLPGLSGMAPRFERSGVTFLRPILSVQGPQIRAWLDRFSQSYVDDPSNQDTQFTRNRIRHKVLPALEGALPGIATAVARTAQHAAQAQLLLDELAAADAVTVGVPPRIKDLQGLSEPRQANLLRWWLGGIPLATPSAAQLAELMGQVAACTTRGHHIGIKVGAGAVVRDRDVLGFVNTSE